VEESDPTRPWWRDARMVAAFVWIFGCATYYYVRFSWFFFQEYGSKLGDVLNGVFANSVR